MAGGQGLHPPPLEWFPGVRGAISQRGAKRPDVPRGAGLLSKQLTWEPYAGHVGREVPALRCRSSGVADRYRAESITEYNNQTGV